MSLMDILEYIPSRGETATLYQNNVIIVVNSMFEKHTVELRDNDIFTRREFTFTMGDKIVRYHGEIFNSVYDDGSLRNISIFVYSVDPIGDLTKFEIVATSIKK